MVNIEGLSKASVLAALYNRAKPLGLGWLQYDPSEMTTEEAEEILQSYKGNKEETYLGNIESPRFEYLKGRVMKVNLKSDIEFDEYLYDRDNGQGAAQEAINSLRGAKS